MILGLLFIENFKKMDNLSNKEIAEILREMGEFLAMQNEPFKPRAYQKAAQTVDELEDSVFEMYQKGGMKALMEIPGIGMGIGQKIEEFIKTGKVKELEGFKKKTPVDLSELSRVEGLGPKSVKLLYQKLDIKNLKELEAAAKAGKIATLEGFGKKSEDKILANIGFAKTVNVRAPIWTVMPEVRALEESGQFNAAEAIARRMVEVFPDQVDVLWQAAVIAAKRGDVDTMLGRYAAAHVLDRRNLIGVKLYVEALMRLQRTAEANVLLDEAIVEWPRDEGLVRWRIENALRLQLFDEALLVWRRLLQSSADDRVLPCKMAALIVAASPPKEGLIMLQEYLEHDSAAGGRTATSGSQNRSPCGSRHDTRSDAPRQ